MMSKPHPSYDQFRLYRQRIVEFQQRYDFTSFSKDAEFWTLGGPDHHEFVYLNEFFDFGPKSYHTVDRGPMASTNELVNNKAIMIYPNMEFFGKVDSKKGIMDSVIDKWSRPAVISYDSTEIIYDHFNRANSHDRKLLRIIEFSRAALKQNKLGTLFVHANYMICYPGTVNIGGLFFRNDLERWLSILISNFPSIEIMDNSHVERMNKSLTDMVDLHFMIRK